MIKKFEISQPKMEVDGPRRDWTIKEEQSSPDSDLSSEELQNSRET